MIRHSRFVFALLAASAMLAGCGNRDPYRRDDVWYPTGANAANLAAQVANPADLNGGRSDPRQSAAAPAKAANRVWMDSPKPLAPSSVGGAGGGGGGTGNGGGSIGGVSTSPGAQGSDG